MGGGECVCDGGERGIVVVVLLLGEEPVLAGESGDGMAHGAEDTPRFRRVRGRVCVREPVAEEDAEPRVQPEANTLDMKPVVEKPEEEEDEIRRGNS